MANLAPLVIESGQHRQLVATDVLLSQLIQAPLPGSIMKIGSNQGAAEIQIGAIGQNTRFLGNIIVDGNATVSTTTNLIGATVMTGDVSMGDDDGDVIQIGGGSSDDVFLNSDLLLGANAINAGNPVNAFGALWMRTAESLVTVGPNSNGYSLNFAQSGAGAYAVGVDASKLLNIGLPAGTTDLMSTLAAMDTAILAAGGANNLNAVINAGTPVNTVTIPDTNEVDWTDNGVSLTNPMFSLTRTATGSGDALKINMGAAATGRGILIEKKNVGPGSAMLIRDFLVPQNQTSFDPGEISQEGGTNLDIGVLSGGTLSGNLTLFAGSNGALPGGATVIRGGDTTGAGTGGQITVRGGSSLVGSGDGGPAKLEGGIGAATKNGGDAYVSAGWNVDASDHALRGEIFILGGRLTTIGKDGVVATNATEGFPVIMAGSTIALSPAATLATPRIANFLHIGGTTSGARTTSGANSIGVGTSLLTNALTAGLGVNFDLQTVLENLDSAIGVAAGGTSLSATMTTAPIANTVSVLSSSEPVFTDSGNALAGAVFTVAKASSSITTGFVVDGTGGSVGASMDVLDTLGASMFALYPDGSTAMGADSATTARFSTDGAGGTALVTTADDKGLTLLAGSATPDTKNELRLDSGATYGAVLESFKTNVSNTLRFGDANIDLISTAVGAETALDITIRSDAGAIGASSGNIRIGATNSVAGGVLGGIILSTQDALFTNATPGTIVIESVDVVTQATADVTFDALGMTSPITVNEAGDLDLIGFTATSIVGSLNELKATAVGGAVSYTAVVESGVTIAIGDCIAASTVTGRITQMNANANANGAFIGIATTAGTGDAGGTVSVTITVAGVVNNQSGLLAGATCFAPDGTGVATITAPADVGDLVFRVGFAISATVMVISAGEGVIL